MPGAAGMHPALGGGTVVVGLLWPGRALYPFDGLPLNGVADAIALGVAGPVLWMLAPRVLDERWVRMAIACLVVLKIAESILLTQHGWCARFQTTAPFHNRVLTI